MLTSKKGSHVHDASMTVLAAVVTAVLALLCTSCQAILGLQDDPPIDDIDDAAVDMDSGPGDAAPNADASATIDAVTIDAGTCLPEDWWRCDFSRRVPLSFDNTGRGLALQDFPVLVRLDGSRISYADADDDGRDIRFVADDGTVLDHEIEAWNDGGDSTVWLRVPTIEADAITSGVFMYYGNPNVSDGSNPSGVWRDSFEAVYHFGDAPAGPVTDSSRGHNGAVTGSLTRADGLFGGSSVFDGNAYIDLGSVQALASLPDTSLTLEVWFRAPYTNSLQHIVHKEGGCKGWRMYRSGTQVTMRAGNASGDCENTQPLSPNLSIQNDAWFYVVGRVDRIGSSNMNVCLYTFNVDADQLAPSEFCLMRSRLENESDVDVPVYLGTNYNQSQTFVGEIDELRVSTTGRSVEWLKAQREATSDRMVQFGGIEQQMP